MLRLSGNMTESSPQINPVKAWISLHAAKNKKWPYEQPLYSA
jgi:hypothetical protein